MDDSIFKTQHSNSFRSFADMNGNSVWMLEKGRVQSSGRYMCMHMCMFMHKL